MWNIFIICNIWIYNIYVIYIYLCMYVYKHRCRKPQAFGLPTLDMLIATKIVVVWKKTKPQIFWEPYMNLSISKWKWWRTMLRAMAGITFIHR